MGSVVLVMWAIVALAGCRGGASPESEAAKVAPIVKTARRGPVEMTVTVDKGEITLADRLKLTIEVVAQEGIDVEMPDFGEALGAFAIRDYREISAEAVGDRRRWQQTYELDIFLSGSYPVPALTARFTDRRKGEDATIESSISTEAFEVTVTSLMEGDFDPTEIRDIKGPVELPADRTWAWLWWTLGGLGGLCGLILVVVWLVRRLRRGPEEIVVPAHEWAFEQLQRLMDDRLVEQGLVGEFYFRLSMIVRQYIERRFGLMAPERTTEEFLSEVQRGDTLDEAHRGTLGSFLQACDMVKFALYEPQSSEIEKAFHAGRDFIDQTADRLPRETTKAAA